MKITRETARNVAHLARIQVEEEELENISSELSSIIGFMEQLNEVDVEGVEAMSSVTPMQLLRRKDIVKTIDLHNKLMSNAPAKHQGFFVVPKVVD